MPVEVVHTVARVEVASSGARVVEIPTAVGPPGPPGLPGGQGVVYEQTVPLATWTIPHTFGRPPVVALYDTSGRVFVCGETVSTDTQVVVSLPSAITGRMVLV